MGVIERTLEAPLRQAAGSYPVVTITGPRQAGKTTLAKACFPDLPYVSVEPLDVRAFARDDPRGFLEEHRAGAIIDEVQHVPSLMSYLQEEVDRDATEGRFVLTGSQNLGLMDAVSQSLAGRTAVLTLLPPSLEELRRFDGAPTDLFTVLWTGAYPRIHDRGIEAGRWLSDYVTTYVQRDVRTVANVGNLEAFTQFVRLCAGRTATEVNYSALGSDAGVTHNTARAWLSVIETGFLSFRVPPWRASVRKRLVKASKLHLVDSGLACNLLGIASADQLRTHPLRGAIFESWVASEILKMRVHRGLPPRLSHYRDNKGLEVDLLVERAAGLAAVEMKSSATVASDFFRALEEFARVCSEPPDLTVVYGGDRRERRERGVVMPWSRLDEIDWS